ncbi:MAG: hypothetical protein D9V47_05870 [Clostridia bacterium]|nr:MAG: hypothetical protein D9V47_05870 [Clostridia bacterium]
MPWSYRLIKGGGRLVPESQEVEIAIRDSRVFASGQPGMSEDSSWPREWLLEREEIIRAARQEAGDILNQAKAQVEALKQQTLSQAREEGFAAGLAAARDEAGRIRQEAREVLRQARQEREDIIRACETEVVQLAAEIAAKILRREVARDSETVLRIARAAVHELCRSQAFFIFAHPDDVEMLYSHRDAVLSEADARAELRVIADPEMPRGSCRVETENGFLDATLDAQLAEISRVIKEQARQRYLADKREEAESD